MAVRKVKDDEGNEYELEIDDSDDSDDEDEDDENIYLTEADLRWLKEQRKAASNSTQQTGQNSKKKSSNGIAVKKRSQNNPTDITSRKKSRIRRLTLSA